MKELTVFEMEEISGGYSWDFSSLSNALLSLASNGVEATAATILGTIAGAIPGSVIGGVFGGNGGGLLGIGSIGQAVGMIYGLIVGGIGGGIAGALVGWDLTLEKSLDMLDGFINGTLAPW